MDKSLNDKIVQAEHKITKTQKKYTEDGQPRYCTENALQVFVPMDSDNDTDILDLFIVHAEHKITINLEARKRKPKVRKVSILKLPWLCLK